MNRQFPTLAACLCLAALLSPARAQQQQQTTVTMVPPSASAGLHAALQASLLQHPALAGKQAQLRAKSATAQSVRAQRYPSLSASAGSGQTRSNSGAHTLTVRAQQPLWAFGRIDNAIAYADSDIQVQAADIRQTRRQLLEETAAAYAAVQGARERLLVAEQSVLRQGELQQQIQRRAQGGLASAVDVGMAQTRLLQARALRESSASELQAAEANLLSLTQDPVATDVPVPADALELPGAEAVREQVLSQSAALHYKESMLALAQADARRERSAGMPTLMLEAAHSRAANLPNTPANSSVNVVLQGSLEGMGMATRGRQEAANERGEAALQDLNLARHELGVRVRQLLDKRDSDRTLLAGYAESVEVLESTLASFRRQYESGYKSWLDVLNALRELSEQQLQQAQLRSSLRINSLRLAAMMGRLDDAAGLNPLSPALESTPQP